MRVLNSLISFVVAFAMLVPQPFYSVVYAQSVSFNPTANPTSINVGDSVTLSANITTTNPGDRDVDWRLVDENDLFDALFTQGNDFNTTNASAVSLANELVAASAANAETVTVTPVLADVVLTEPIDIEFRARVKVGTAPRAAKFVTVTINPTPTETAAAPTFTNSIDTDINVVENIDAVGAPLHFVASTTDSADVTYTTGGVNGGLFDLVAGTLTFKNAPDFETPLGGAAPHTNTYTVDVIATANGAEVSETVTVTVTNADEPANAFTIESGEVTTTSIVVTWNEATTVGAPPIDGYHFTVTDVVAGTNTFPSAGIDDRSITITGLTPNTEYRIGADADNGEGTTSSDSITVTTLSTTPTTPTGFTISATPLTVTESSSPTDIGFTITLTGGGTFSAPRTIRFNTNGGTATPVTDYTAVANHDFTFPANTTSSTATIPFTAATDTITEAGGETVIFEATLLNADGSAAQAEFAVVPTTITINDPVVTTPPTGPTFERQNHSKSNLYSRRQR